MRVLLVEDYAPIQKSVAKGLREAGFAVDVSGNGEEGLWYATGNDYEPFAMQSVEVVLITACR